MSWRPRTGLPWWDRPPPQWGAFAALVALSALAFSPVALEIWSARTAILPAASAARAAAEGRVIETRIDEMVEAEIAAARIRIEPGTEVELPPADAPPDRPVEIRLRRGGLHLTVAPRRPDAPFVVRTPVATAGVRGTRFRVLVPEALVTEVVVEEGLVALQGLVGPEVLLRAGEAGTVRGMGKPAQRTRTIEATRPAADLPPWAKREGATVALPEDERPAAETEGGHTRNWSRLPARTGSRVAPLP